MEKTPQQILRDFFNECEDEVQISTEEDTLTDDYNILRVYGEIEEGKKFLFSLMGVNLKMEFEKIFKEVCDSFLEECDFDIAD